MGEAAIVPGCVFCIYEAAQGMPSSRDEREIPRVPPATHTIETARGERNVCEGHAFRGTWNGEQ